jgi:hypothetical protein
MLAADFATVCAIKVGGYIFKNVLMAGHRCPVLIGVIVERRVLERN